VPTFADRGVSHGQCGGFILQMPEPIFVKHIQNVDIHMLLHKLNVTECYFSADLLQMLEPIFVKHIHNVDIHMLLHKLNVTECYFSVDVEQRGGLHYAIGAGPYAGLTVVLNTRQLEYFAPVDPLYGIWVSMLILLL
jgi:hypothetical protein